MTSEPEDYTAMRHCWTAPARAACLTLTSPVVAPDMTPNTSNPEPDHNVTPNQRNSLTQEQIDEVVRIMQVNVDKVVEIDISELEYSNAEEERRRKCWWKNCRVLVVVGLICIVLVIIILLYSLI
ncbi:vesicle-associated membrane protein 1 isoform X2 [Dendropsophus ebraccatus]|uniref:vesicle-associated membrane protein 1 isoform X2 n=1 Tax=Dendropsophus ebraccatus TaxID=150705 RepID=UPI0038317DF5